MDRRMVKPDCSTPAKMKRYIESEIRRIEDAVKRVRPDAEAYLSGAFAARRQKALLNYMGRAEEELGSWDLISLVESIVRRELVTFSNYNSIDVNGDILIGASLWILEKLRAGGKMKDAYDILPDVSGDIDAYCLPVDFSHPCYSNDLIQSVVYILARRFPSARMTGCIITEENALGKEPGGIYEKLMALLPRDDVREACDRFREKTWEILTRFMKGRAYYDRELEMMAKQVELRNTVLAPLMSPALGTGGAEDDMALEFIAKYDELMERNQCYMEDFDDYLQMERKQIKKRSGSREVADALCGFEVRDPYELLFALLYLIDHGDDAPWLFGSGSSLIRYALQMLPWFTDESDWEEEDWDDWYEGLTYDRNGWLEKDAPPEKLDYYHQKHRGRNLAQVIYGLCRSVVPVGLHPFEEDRVRLVNEGMEEDVARKITDTAELMFLTMFQARQINYDDWPGSDGEEEENGRAEELRVSGGDPGSHPGSGKTVADRKEGGPGNASDPPLKLGGYWGRVAAAQGMSTDEAAGPNPEEAAVNDAEENVLLNEELKALKKQLKSLRNALAVTRQEANSEKVKYEHELRTLRMEHRELADLRNLVFNQKSEDPQQLEPVKTQYEFPYKTIRRTVIFGGHDSFLKAIRPMFPTVKFVDPDYMTFSPEIIRNADVVWIQNNCISHSQYWNIVRICKTADVQMRYFGYASAEKCAEQLVDEDRK